MPKELKLIKGVNFTTYSTKKEDVEACHDIEKTLLEEGAEFREKNPAHPPWLAARHPFALNGETVKKIKDLGRATFSYFDAIQKLYPDSPAVRQILDTGVPDDLRGLDVHKKLATFRFDMIIENGEPMISEMEEVYSAIGFTHAINAAYQIDSDLLYESLAKTGIRNILMDEKWSDYVPELSIVQKRLKKQCDMDVNIGFFSEFKDHMAGSIYRFAYMRSFEKYPPELRKKLISGNIDYINPLFHGFAEKAIFNFLFDDTLAPYLQDAMGKRDYEILKKASPLSERIDSDGSSEQFDELMENRRQKVIKVIHSPDPDYEWGARGVYMGRINKNRWAKIAESVVDGRIPNHPEIKGAVFMRERFVESDRYEIPFFDPVNNQVSLMSKATILLRPIFFRHDGLSRLVSSTATFVNTSKKVHWGSHAVVAPVDVS